MNKRILEFKKKGVKLVNAILKANQKNRKLKYYRK